MRGILCMFHMSRYSDGKSTSYCLSFYSVKYTSYNYLFTSIHRCLQFCYLLCFSGCGLLQQTGRPIWRRKWHVGPRIWANRNVSVSSLLCSISLKLSLLVLDLSNCLFRSRLGCQIEAKPELDGIRLALPVATRNFAVDGYKPKPH